MCWGPAKIKFSIVSVFKKHVVRETDMKTGRKHSFLWWEVLCIRRFGETKAKPIHSNQEAMDHLPGEGGVWTDLPASCHALLQSVHTVFKRDLFNIADVVMSFLSLKSFTSSYCFESSPDPLVGLILPHQGQGPAHTCARVLVFGSYLQGLTGIFFLFPSGHLHTLLFLPKLSSASHPPMPLFFCPGWDPFFQDSTVVSSLSADLHPCIWSGWAVSSLCSNKCHCLFLDSGFNLLVHSPRV